MTRTRPGNEHGHQLLPAEERRRSQRVIIRVPVTLHLVIVNQAVTFRAMTVSVNDHGAMLLSTRTIDSGTTLQLQNDLTRQQISARVTRPPQEGPEGYLIPVEFMKSTPGFWQISFPPVNWRPVED